MKTDIEQQSKKSKNTLLKNDNQENKIKGEDQYENITQEYKASKMLPFRTESETPTFLKLLGSELGEQNICDLACGEGFYTRKYRKLTRGRVVGVDISENMIKLAKSQQQPLNKQTKIEYYCNDACVLAEKHEFTSCFDIVTATFLLNYSSSKEMLDAFVKGAFRFLKPGGRFIGINTSPFIKNQETFDKTHKYSLEYTTDNAPIKEGDLIHINIKMKDGDAKFDNYFWNNNTYEIAFEKAGFDKLKWINLTLVEGNDTGFWQDWLENCPIIIFSAIKPENTDSTV